MLIKNISDKLLMATVLLLFGKVNFIFAVIAMFMLNFQLAWTLAFVYMFSVMSSIILSYTDLKRFCTEPAIKYNPTKIDMCCVK